MSRPFHATPLSALAAKAGAKAFARYGFTEQALIRHWTEIMGESLGRMTLPLKLSTARGGQGGGTLRVLAEPVAALELQHLMPVVIDRINATFGYPAVKTIQIQQGPAARPPEREAKDPVLDAQTERDLAATLEPVEDDALRASLARLGRALYGCR